MMKKVLGVLLVLILIAGGGVYYFYSQATSTDIGEPIIAESKLEQEKVDEVFNVLSNLKDSEEPVEMESEQVNALTNEISKEIGSKSGVTVESINSKVENGKLHVQIPTVVKGKTIMLSAKADLKCEDGKLVVKLDNLKSGKLELPKDAIGDKIGEMIKDERFNMEGNEIKIDLEKLPYDIKDIKIEGNKLLINGEEVENKE